MKIKLLTLPLLAVAAACGRQSVQQEDLCAWVNPLQGTNSTYALSSGNNYPAVARPWGMNFWVAQTGKMGDGWQYTWADSTICGFKQTHQPSPWINDFGCFSIMPGRGQVKVTEKERASRFTHRQEWARPDSYGVMLDSPGIKAEMTTSSRGAIFRFTYPKDTLCSVLVDCYDQDGWVKVLPQQNKIIGYSRFYSHSSGASYPDNFATYFVITCSKPIKSFGAFRADTIMQGKDELGGNHVGAYICFSTGDGEHVELKVASSFISAEQAQLNFDREVAAETYATLQKASADEWNGMLGRTQIKGATDEQKRTFYTAMYRTMLFPHAFWEADARGDTVHYSPFLGTVERGPMYTGNGFWDTFRAVHPYFTIMYPDMSSRIVEGLDNYYKEGGWIPEWFSGTYKDCMIGQNSVSVITDAYLKGIRGYDIESLWQGIIKGANAEGPKATGRRGFDFYNRLGYIPYNVGVNESVSRTLEYAYDDWCIWQLGKALGKPDSLLAVYRKRAQNYRNIVNPATGFVTPRDDKGNWQPGARPDSWGGSFTEGSSWHWTWAVFHDPQGLIDMLGGDAKALQKMDSVFTAEPTFDYSAYGSVIHEMTEMAECKMGQYAHGNQPIQHMIYLYDWAGEPYKAQYHVREVMDKLYRSGVEDGKGLCGDEDNGQTSAWYVFSAMGFYPVCPGSLEYAIGSPLFEQVSLTLENGKTFTVAAHGNSTKNIYIQSAKLDGKPFDKSYITHAQIMTGGTLEFTMGPEPNKAWASTPQSRPYSMSNR